MPGLFRALGVLRLELGFHSVLYTQTEELLPEGVACLGPFRLAGASDMLKVALDTPVEDLVLNYPEAVGFLTRRGVRCIRCGEPLWCSLGELFREDKVSEPDVLLTELQKFLAGPKAEGGG